MLALLGEVGDTKNCTDVERKSGFQEKVKN